MLDHRAQPAPALPPATLPRVLLADDDAAARRILAASLTSAGFDVLTAANGEEALAQVLLSRPDVLVLDFEMPGIDGAEVCRRVRALPDPELREIPALMLTAHGGEAEEVACLGAGANDFVSKPVSRAILEARLRTHLRLGALGAELRAQNAELARWREVQEADLEMAQITQRLLIPAHPPALAGWQVATHYEPVIQVGGDVFGWHPAADGAYYFWLADATGHGAAAALLTTHAALLFEQACQHESSPGAVLRAVNREFHHAFHGRLYMTALCVLVHPNGRLSCAGAGHPPLIVRTAAGEVRTWAAQGTMLGVLPESAGNEDHTTLQPGDTAWLYTDGLFSLKNPEGERLEPETVEQAARTAGDLAALLAAMQAQGDGAPFEDDLALIELRR